MSPNLIGLILQFLMNRNTHNKKLVTFFIPTMWLRLIFLFLTWIFWLRPLGATKFGNCYWRTIIINIKIIVRLFHINKIMCIQLWIFNWISNVLSSSYLIKYLKLGVHNLTIIEPLIYGAWLVYLFSGFYACD